MGAKQRMGDDLLIELWCTVFFHFHFPVPRVRSLVPGPRSLCPVLRSSFSLRRCPFSVLRFSVSPFPVPRCPLPVLLVPRSSFLVILFFYKIVNNEAIVHNFFRMKKQSKVRTSRCLRVLTDGSGRNKTNDSVTLWFQRQNLFSLLCMLKYISQESVLCSLHRREHLQVYSAKGGKL